MIFGSNLLSVRLTVTIFLLPLIYSSAIPENISTDQTFANSGYFRKTSSRIIKNGIKARPGQFPYQVSLDVQARHFCDGVILNSWWVLTAGNCVFRNRKNLRHKLKIVAGELELRYHFNALHVRQGIRFLYHDIYYGESEKIHFDIGLIKVHEEWNFDTPDVKPINYLRYSLPVNTSCTVSGWGQTARGSTELQYTQQYLYDNDFCNTIVPLVGKNPYNFKFTEETLCAGNLDIRSGPCYKNGGQPLVCAGYLAGIFMPTGRVGCDGDGFPNIYINVSFFWPLIRASIFPSISKTHTLHIASTTFCMVNFVFILYCVIVYV